MATTDADMVLLARFAQARDSDAFAELIRRYAHMVFASCNRILKDSGRAEEASQEIFFKLLRNPEKVKHSVGAWLHATAVNFSLDTLRSESARERREQEYAARHARNHVAALPEAEVEPTWAELSGQVDELLLELPEEYREILIAHYLQGRTQQEIAAELKVSTATLSRRVNAAIAMLQQKLRQRGTQITPIVLGGMFRDHAMQAAPVTLRMQLGKMTMLSGPKIPGSAAISNGTAAGSAPIGWVSVVILAASISAGLITMFFSSRPSTNPLPGLKASPASSATSVPTHGN